VIDPEWPVSAPPEVTASSGLTLSQLIESYTSIGLNHENALRARVTLAARLPRVCADGADLDPGGDGSALFSGSRWNGVGGVPVCGPAGRQFPCPHLAGAARHVVSANIAALAAIDASTLLERYAELGTPVNRRSIAGPRRSLVRCRITVDLVSKLRVRARDFGLMP